MRWKLLIALLICIGFSISYARHSVKKKNSAKPVLKYNTIYKTGPYLTKADTGTQKHQIGKVTVHPDSATTAHALTDKSLNGQYHYMLSKFYHYQQPLISLLWKNASDTLNANRRELAAALGKLNSQSKNIDSLKTEIAKVEATNARIGGMEVFGVLLSKTAYNLIVWGLVLILGLTAAIAIARLGGYRREARYRTQLYSELEEEYKAYKAKANDKEKKLARELQTERNKLDELLGKG